MNHPIEVKWSGGSFKAANREELISFVRTILDVFNIGFYELWPDVTPPHGMASEEQIAKEYEDTKAG